MKTEDNYYRIILETVWGYSKEELNNYSDEDCENELQVICSR